VRASRLLLLCSTTLSMPRWICQGGARKEANRVADRVEALIRRLAPEPICDACIVERLGLPALHQASHRTRELAGTRGFERIQAACATCGEDRPTIRRK